MAQKKTYVYHLLIGHDNKVEEDIFAYARNAGQIIDYCKELYKDKKYNSYQAIKIGASFQPREMQIMTSAEAENVRKIVKADKYAEREVRAPEFVPAEEAGEIL